MDWYSAYLIEWCSAYCMTGSACLTDDYCSAYYDKFSMSDGILYPDIQHV